MRTFAAGRANGDTIAALEKVIINNGAVHLGLKDVKEALLAHGLARLGPADRPAALGAQRALHHDTRRFVTN